MLNEIYITNYTLVDKLHLTLEKGLSVLTGETGAGKSIIIGALSLALGARANNKIIHHNAEQCDISVCFNLQDNTPAQAWLQEHDLADNEECIIRRIIEKSGKSRSTINGRPCPQSLCRDFARHILQIHSQHQHQNLLDRHYQQQLFDDYAQNNILLKKIIDIYQQWRNNQHKLDELCQQAQQRDQQLELLRYQAQELTELALQEDEWEKLHREHHQLQNAKQLLTNLNNALQLTQDDEQHASAKTLQMAIDHLNEIDTQDNQLNAIKELLHTAAIHLQEASDELYQYRDALDLSPEHLARIEQRLTLIHDIARKHHVAPEELVEMGKSLQQQINELENVDAHIAQLKQQQQILSEKYQSFAQQLSQRRKDYAKQLNNYMSKQMQQLGMQGGEFVVQLDAHNEPLHPSGYEKISFSVRTNPGQALQPMHTVVSGGELSRISLALQALTIEKYQIPTIAFDEVDVGIGGKTAEIVGKLLQSLSQHTQVICITHLAQVAAQGHHHFKVAKNSDGQHTHTRIQALNESERIQELARMLSGSKITAETLAHAEQMLSEASPELAEV